MRLPKEPNRHTCPDINRIQSTLQEFINYKPTEDYVDDLESFRIDFGDIIRTLEELRESNSELRNWGNDLLSIAENLETEKDHFESLADDYYIKYEDLKIEFEKL